MQTLITGANRGIGAALVAEGVARGHSITGTSRNGDGADVCDWLAVDVADPASITAMAQAWGDTPLDLLVLNAGVYLDKGNGLDAGFPPDIWAQTMAVNVSGVFLSAQALMDNVIAAKGRIAVIASVMASSARAPGGGYAYRASKAAAVNISRNLAVDLAPMGVSVGAYHPGWVRTEMGGGTADIDVETSAKGLWTRFEALSLETTGCFEAYDGAQIPF